MSVDLVTSIGTISIKLYTDLAPLTCRNFIKLCKLKYYCWCIFNPVERDFIAQTGSILGAAEEEGSSFDGLIKKGSRHFTETPSKGLRHRKKGLISMINGTGSNKHHEFQSQFYFTLTDRPLDYLDEIHLIFGEVVGEEGRYIMDKFNATAVDDENHPLIDVFIMDAIVHEDPFPNPLDVAFPTSVPPPPQEFLQKRRVDPQDPDAHLTLEQRAQNKVDRDIRRHALTLELLGERSSADLEAPDNVLFICRLHPWTEAEDLVPIMNHFGRVDRCDIVCDRETGESKGYGFVEFIDRHECENAYKTLTAEDVELIIDERKVKVDFCHSLHKVERNPSQRHAYRRREGDYRRDRPDRSDRSDYHHQRRDRLDYHHKHENRYESRGRRHSKSPSRSKEDYHRYPRTGKERYMGDNFQRR